MLQIIAPDGDAAVWNSVRDLVSTQLTTVAGSYKAQAHPLDFIPVNNTTLPNHRWAYIANIERQGRDVPPTDPTQRGERLAHFIETNLRTPERPDKPEYIFIDELAALIPDLDRPGSFIDSKAVIKRCAEVIDPALQHRWGVLLSAGDPLAAEPRQPANYGALNSTGAINECLKKGAIIACENYPHYGGPNVQNTYLDHGGSADNPTAAADQWLREWMDGTATIHRMNYLLGRKSAEESVSKVVIICGVGDKTLTRGIPGALDFGIATWFLSRMMHIWRNARPGLMASANGGAGCYIFDIDRVGDTSRDVAYQDYWNWYAQPNSSFRSPPSRPGNVFTLRYPNNGFLEVPFGAPGDVPIAGNWFLEGFQPGVYRPSTRVFYLRTAAGGAFPLAFGNPGDRPITGRWTANDPYTNLGVYRPSTREFFLRATSGAVTTIVFGDPGDVPITGDWFGFGFTQIGVYRPSTGVFFLRAPNGASVSTQFGNIGDVPITGDWNGDGITDVGVYRPGERQFFWPGLPSGVRFGSLGDVPVAGDFNNDGVWELGSTYRP